MRRDAFLKQIPTLVVAPDFTGKLFDRNPSPVCCDKLIGHDIKGINRSRACTASAFNRFGKERIRRILTQPPCDGFCVVQASRISKVATGVEDGAHVRHRQSLATHGKQEKKLVIGHGQPFGLNGFLVQHRDHP
jgi:hypothetical protein